MNIAIVGTGYVGLVSGACFADTGASVTCVDVDTEKIERIKRGEIPIYEPGLDELVLKNVKAGRLRFTTSLESVLNDQQIVFSAVGTPPDEDGSADLKYLLDKPFRPSSTKDRPTLSLMWQAIPNSLKKVTPLKTS